MTSENPIKEGSLAVIIVKSVREQLHMEFSLIQFSVSMAFRLLDQVDSVENLHPRSVGPLRVQKPKALLGAASRYVEERILR